MDFVKRMKKIILKNFSGKKRRGVRAKLPARPADMSDGKGLTKELSALARKRYCGRRYVAVLYYI